VSGGHFVHILELLHCGAGCKSGCGNDLASYSHCRRSDVISADDDVPEDYRCVLVVVLSVTPSPAAVNIATPVDAAFCYFNLNMYKFPGEHRAI